MRGLNAISYIATVANEATGRRFAKSDSIRNAMRHDGGVSTKKVPRHKTVTVTIFSTKPKPAAV